MTDLHAAAAAYARRCRAVDMTDARHTIRCYEDWTVDLATEPDTLGRFGKVCAHHARLIRQDLARQKATAAGAYNQRLDTVPDLRREVVQCPKCGAYPDEYHGSHTPKNGRHV